MKENTHPRSAGAIVTCACGNVIETSSTKGDFRIDVCNACHPFYTGKQKQVVATGRVEQFNKRYKRN